jgi:hypothetical protein
MPKCEVCEAQPSSYVDPVDYQMVCQQCFFKAVMDMLDPSPSEEVLEQSQSSL